MARTRIVLQGVLAATCAVLGACKQVDAVAKVNGKPIAKEAFEAQVERNMARYKGEGQQLPPNIEMRIQESVLRRMVEDEVMAQKAHELGVDVSDAEVDAKLKEHRNQFRSEQAFADYLARSRNSEETLKGDLKRSMLRDRVVEKVAGVVDVGDAEVKKYYDDNAQRFTELEQVRARRIVVRLPQTATPADKAAKLKQAKKLHDLAVKKGADFGKIAREHSEGPEAPSDGDLGMFGRNHMQPELEAVAFALAPQQVSDVIETNLGYEIVQVLEKRPEKQKPFEEVKDNIRVALSARQRSEKRRESLLAMRNAAKVEYIAKFEPTAAPAGQPPPGGAAAPPAPAAGAGAPEPPPAAAAAPPPPAAVPPPPPAGAP